MPSNMCRTLAMMTLQGRTKRVLSGQRYPLATSHSRQKETTETSGQTNSDIRPHRRRRTRHDGSIVLARCRQSSHHRRFRRITTFAVYVNACDLEKSFSFDQSRNYESRAFFNSYRAYTNTLHTAGRLVRAIFPEVWEFERFQTVEMIFKVTQCHWYWCHPIEHVISH